MDVVDFLFSQFNPSLISMSDLETVSSVTPDVVPVEEPSVSAPLGELLGEEIMEDCRLMTLALMRVRSICSSEAAHCCDC